MIAEMQDAPLETALKDGRTLVEASAGSGKTRAITTLVARLVVEQGRALDSILVVTFTKAATAELRKRIRGTLKALRDEIAEEARADDGQAKDLLEKWNADDLDPDQVKSRIETALFDIDRANVFTIHGFCQRALTEFAFETGFPFGFEISGDGGGIVETVVRDIWQHRFQSCSKTLARYVLEKKFMPAELAGWFGTLRSKPNLERRGLPESIINPDNAETACKTVQDRTRDIWDTHAGEFRRFLASGALNRTTHADKRVADWLAEIEHVFSTDALSSATGALETATGKLGRNALSKACKKGCELTENPLLDAFDELSAAYATLSKANDHWLMDTRRLLMDEAADAVRRQIRNERRLGYDDLLSEMRDALEGPAGERLASGLRSRFPAALIDEFQDTDPMQAGIFDRIYNTAEDARACFYIVGDPKQSIYEFRGADIFAYLAQKRGEITQLQLGHNWRSTPELVRAVNTIFDVPVPFALPEIAFTNAEPGRDERERLEIDGKSSPPLEFWLLPEQENNDGADAIAVNETANGIIKLLGLARTGRALIKGRPLKGSDIAVLVHTRAQGQNIINALRARGGRCVEIANASVFETREAEQLLRLLQALANPARQDLKRAALTGDLFGLNSEELLALSEEDEPWSRWTGRFGEWRETWLARGIGAMLRRVIEIGDGAGNLLKYADGPRRLTNLRHLAELLQEAETGERLSPAGLVSWFSLRRDAQSRRDDAAELRIESDEELVKVITIHGSKGLEFPIVYLPFAWFSKQVKGNNGSPVKYHRRDGEDFPAVLDFDPDDQRLRLRQMEEFGESIRKFYVALTRASERCVVAWTRVSGKGKKELPPLAWLAHRTADHDAMLGETGGDEDSAVPGAVADAHDSVREHFINMSPKQFRADIETVRIKCPSGISIREIGDGSDVHEASAGDEAVEVLECREFRRETRRIRQMTSFTALSAEEPATAGAPQHIDAIAQDHDESEGIPVEASDTRDTEEGPAEFNAFNFPRGIRVGTCLHGIFEKLDEEPERETSEVCAAQLTRAGIDPLWLEAARTMVENTLTTQLQEPGQKSFRLADIHRRLTELEFAFPVNGVRRAGLAEVLARHGYKDLLSGSQDTHPIDGFLRGFIDLTFEHEGRWYVLDYKSNWLGDASQDYDQDRLDSAMSEHRYQLQYLIYLLALHRYLKTRLADYDYDRHIGGAFYLFLRGMDPAAGMARGIYFDRPAPECIEALDAYMRGNGS